MQLNTLARLERDKNGLTDTELAAAVKDSLPDDLTGLKKVLLIPPDATRAHSMAGLLTNMYFRQLSPHCGVDVLPALGTHSAMTESECGEMFGDIPYSCFLRHNWRSDIISIGSAPAEVVREISGGFLDEPIDFEVNRALLRPEYSLIISIGQVVPHEVVGMANYTKNILVGCGGSRIINASHMLGAYYGLERLMGKDHSPVRKLFDYAERNILKRLPLSYVLTVVSGGEGKNAVNGLFIGRERGVFEQAAALSQERNITLLDRPLQKVAVYLDPKEYRSTWLGNKAIYRTRMAIADGGELIILAPGVERFGEDDEIDMLIRKYGYRGRDEIIARVGANDDLRLNLSAAAHLIHGSSEGRFNITYCPGHLTKKEVEGVGYGYLGYDKAAELYPVAGLKDGYNALPGGELYFIENPAVGLWAERGRFKEDSRNGGPSGIMPEGDMSK